MNTDKSETAATTILFQAPNSIGLGHMSRLAAIALALREQRPDVRAPFLIEGGSHHLLESLGIPYVSVPHRDDFEAASWELWTNGERWQLVSAMASAAIRSLKPRAIVFDSFPLPAAAEITMQVKVPIVLVARKMQNMPAYFGQMETFNSFLRLVLFPHDPGEFEVPVWLGRKSRFVGRIVRPAVVRHEPRQANSSKRVVISGGGGGYPETVDFYNAALAALASCRNRRAVDTTLITGPLFRQWDDLKLIEGVKVLPFVADLPSIVAGADLVLCEAGYNTIAEVMQLGTTAILVPAPRFGDDQFERAENAAAESSVVRVWHQTSAEPLDILIDQCLDSSCERKPPDRISTPGAKRAASAIFECL